MPRLNLISSRRDAGELEAAALVGNGVIRVRDNHHLRVHPNVAAVAAKVDQAGRAHAARADLVGEREGQVVSCRAVHVDGVQSSVGALHLQIGLFRHQKNVRNVVATALVEVASLLRKFQHFAGRDVFEIYDGIGYPAVRADDEPLKADGFLALRVADLGIFGDRKVQFARDRARPFHGTGNSSTVGDGDDFIVALRDRERCSRKKEKEQRIARH